MTDARPPSRFEELVELLEHRQIASCESRTGLRRRTGDLLEDAFVALATGLAPDLSVEIGAHEASFSVRLKRARPKMPVWAFEANPYVFEKYLHAPDNPLQSVEYRNAAICARTGFVDLHIPRKWPKGSFERANAVSSLLPRTSEQFEYEKVRVPALTLDEAVGGIEFRNAVAWIDVEGGQREVIEAAPRFLSNASAIYIEVETMAVWSGQTMADEVRRLLAQHGLFPVLRDNLARIQFNEIYTRRNEACAAVATPIVSQYIEDVTGLLSPNALAH